MSADEQRKLAQREQVEKGVELRGWWMTEMLTTPSPLTEKMVLFWHNHFVSSLQKVRSPVLMYRQQLVLRKHALGYFGDLLHEVSKDPAMVIYLDNASNRKGQPNENFAREVMELFTLGEGNYKETDIKEAARAFTGWSIDPDTGEFVARPQDPRRRRENDIGPQRQLRWRCRARHSARAAVNRRVHRRQAVARVRVADPGRSRSQAHRAPLSRQPL